MKQFFKFMFASMFGVMFLFALGFFALIAIGLASSGGEKVTISKKSVLKLKLNKSIQERSEENPFENTRSV